MNASPSNTPEKRRPASKRFDRDALAARLAPAIMVILALALLLSLAVVILSVLGLTPGL